MERFKKRLNNIYFVLLTSVSTFTLTACGGGSSSPSKPVAPNDDSGSTQPTINNSNDNEETTTSSQNNLPPTGLTVPTTVSDGAKIVGAIRFDDENPADASITLSGSDAGSFEVQGQQLRLKTEASFETKSTYNLTVTVADDINQTQRTDVVISVERVAKDAPSLRVEAVQTAPGVYEVKIFVDQESDPGSAGLETFLINVAYDAEVGDLIEGSFETNFELSMQNTAEDGNLSFTGVTINPKMNFQQEIMSFDIALEEGQDPENLLLEFFQVSIDDVSFANTEIAIA